MIVLMVSLEQDTVYSASVYAMEILYSSGNPILLSIVWLKTDVVYYFYSFIILFMNCYSEYYVYFYARFHFFLSLSAYMYIFS